MSQRKNKLKRWQEKVNARQEIEFHAVSLWWEGLRKNIKKIFVLVLFSFGLYLNSLNGAFVSDDYATISQYPMIGNLVMTFKQSGVGGIINWLNNQIFGLSSPLPYHLASSLLYVVVIIGVYLLMSLIFKERVAWITALLYAVLPIHVEAVAWISGKPYLLNAIGVIYAMILFVLWHKSGERKYWWYFLLSLPVVFILERVRSIALIPVMIVYLLAFGSEGKIKINWGKIWLIGVGFILIAGVLLYPLIISRINSVNSGYNSSESIFYNPFFQYPTAIAKYLQVLVIPIDLTLYHTMFTFPAWLNWAILLTYLIAVIYFFFKNKKYFWALAFIFAAAIPSMAPVKVSWLMAERYLFLGSLGFAMLIALLTDELEDKVPKLGWVWTIMLILIFGVRTVVRNNDWSTNHNLWVATVQVSPNSHNAWNNIGDDYDKLGQMDNAVKGFTQSTIVKPNYADAYHNRANIFYKIKRYDLARDSYLTALKYNPGLYQTYISLTQIDLMENKLEEAINHAQAVVKLEPNNAQSWYILGIVYAQAGVKDEAIKALENASRLGPDNQAIKQALLQLKQ